MEGSVAEQEGQTATAQEGAQEKPPAVPEDARRDPDAPETVTDSIARAREKLEQGGSIADLADEGDAAEEEVAAALEADAEAQEGEEPAEPEIERPDLALDEKDVLPDSALPEGFQYDEHNRLHRPDGSYASLAEHEELRKQFQATGEEAPEEELEEEPTAEAEEEEEQLEDEDYEDLVVEIPGRNPDESFELVAHDEETAERLRQLSNAAMRREEYNRQVESLESRFEEFREVEREFQADPAAFLAEEVKPEIRKDVVLRLLADDATYDEVASTLRQWEMNPDRKRADIAELERDAYKRKDEVSREDRVRQTARSAARQARQHMETLVDEAGISGPAAEKILKDGMSELGQAMMQAEVYDISLDQAKNVLSQTGTLDLLGLSANGSKGRSSSRGGSSEETRSKGRVRAVDPDSEEAEKARRTGEELEKKAGSRRAAAATPQGAGASAASQVQPPEGQSVEERIKWARKKGLGAVLSGQ